MRPPVDRWAIAALPIALAAGWLFTARPRLIELAALLVLALPLLVSPRVRILFLVVGTLTVFGPEELSTSKLLFLFGATVALVGAFSRSRALARTPEYADLLPLLRASAALLFVVALSLPVAHFHGVPHQEWLRDVAPYVLVAWAPLFALDAQAAFTSRGLRRLIALVGLAGAAAFMIKWYGSRHITDISGSFGLATFLLGGALFAFAIAMALDATRARLRWLALGALVFAMLATTGTRTSAVLVAAPLLIVLGTRQQLTRRSMRLLAVLPLAALLVGLGTHSLLRLFDANTDVLSSRIELLFQSGRTDDQSYVNRVSQIKAAWALFRSEPVFGAGPGHPIAWTDYNGNEVVGQNVDTPVGFLVDYGLIGLAAIRLFAASFVSVVRRLRSRVAERPPGQLALIGFGGIILAYSFLQVPFEDKGLWVGLILLLAMAMREASERSARRRTQVS